MTALSLADNTFTGPLPESIGKLTALVSFSVNNNYLNGTIPASISRWLDLEDAYLFNNTFSGIVPDEICDVIEKGDELEVDERNAINCTCCTTK